MENSKLEKVKQFAGPFFNKIIDELNNDLVNASFVKFLEKKHLPFQMKKKKLFIVELF